MERNLADYFHSRLWPGFIVPKKFKVGGKLFVTNKASGFLVDGVDGDAMDVPKLRGPLKRMVSDGFDLCVFERLLEMLLLKNEEILTSESFCAACKSMRRILCPWCCGTSCYECQDNGTLPCSCSLVSRDYPLVAFRLKGECFDARMLRRAWGIFGELESSERRLLVSTKQRAMRVDCDWGSYFQAGIDLDDHSNCTIWEVAS